MPPVQSPNSIAVIIPAYNAIRFIGETLESVLGQTLPPDEVLVIDDGSTDNTAEFAESYGPPVRVFRRDHLHQAAARNFAATQTQCEWLAFVDSDDLWAPDKLELQAAKLVAHPEADLCYTGRRLMMQEGDTATLGRIVETPPAKDLYPWLFKDVSFLAGTILIRRSTFLAAGGFNPSFKFVEDWDLWMRLLHSGCRFIDCPEPLLLYRVHSANTSLNAMGILGEVDLIRREQMLPYLPKRWRFIRNGRFWSRHEAEAAFVMRRTGDPRHLSMMGRSLVHWPFDDRPRFKVFAHMLYTRIRKMVSPAPAPKS